MDPIAPAHGDTGVLAGLIDGLGELMAQRRAHAARTVVLVPYAQLMPLARRLWAARAPDGFSPRFETTLNWAARTGFAPGPDDLSFDRGLDLLAAHAWLERAGLGPHAGLLAGPLVDAAWQLAGVVAGLPPAERGGWVVRARTVCGLGLDHPVMAMESALARIAVEWAAASAYATDALLAPANAQSLDLLVVLQGLQPEPVAQALVQGLGQRAVSWSLDQPAAAGQVHLHEAPDPALEAEMAAACVMRHLQAGRSPVALAAVDRVLTRRIRATLAGLGVAQADETGWKLSTTRAAAQVMGLLKAGAWDAASDDVLDWLKNTPGLPAGLALSLERRVRRAGLRAWTSVAPERLCGGDELAQAPPWAGLIEQANTWRARLRQPRPLAQWQQCLRELLGVGGQWDQLEADAAGAQLIAALGLDEAGQALWSQVASAQRRLSLADFTRWAGEVLEAASFVPDAPASAQVVILPFNQLLGRRFAALVIPGCDELRLPASPEPPGAWTAAQRALLGLPPREQLAQTLRHGWRSALQTPWVDVLWRRTDDTGEPVMASALVQELVRKAGARPAAEVRDRRELVSRPVARPQALAPDLPVAKLSASAYEDLRRCPYRFFALRQLGLQEAAEIDVDLDKRDFGNWLHEVLRRFHEALAGQAPAGRDERVALIDQVAAQTREAMALPEGEFLPFAAAWPQVRDGYLEALAAFEAKEGARFHTAETEHEMPLGSVSLSGRIDRIDQLPDGQRMVLDYKTEALATTQARIKTPLEDTQIAFYAALLGDDSLRGAYVNIGERGQTRFIEQTQVQPAREALVLGILNDLRRISEGAAIQALGEGASCEYCAARGLCRKDFWQP